MTAGEAPLVKLADMLAETRDTLARAGVDASQLDSRLIVEHFSGTSRTDSIVRPDMPVAGEAVHAIHEAVRRRAAGEPVHRILGFREFYGLKLHLSAGTLEPRPDTEVLVDAVLPRLRQLAASQESVTILDLGTGTGAIALALLAQVPEARALGVDISPDALATAARNADENNLSDRFEPLASDWFGKISGVFHVIVSNPPYIETKEIETLQREVRDHDPMVALDGGPDGLAAYRIISQGAALHLAEDGFVAVEIGHAQAIDVTRLFETAGFRLSEARQDLGGRDRVLVFERE